MIFSLDNSARFFHLLIRPINQLRGDPGEIKTIAQKRGLKAVWELLELPDEELGWDRSVLVDMFNISEGKRTITHALRSLLVQVRDGVYPDTTVPLNDEEIERAEYYFASGPPLDHVFTY